MPDLDTSAIFWIAGLSLAAVMMFVFVSPRLIPMLARDIHDSDAAKSRRLTVIDKITLYMASILMFLTAIIVAIMFYEVVMRYVFSEPTIWVEELSRWLGGIVFLLSGLYAMQQRSHIRVVVLYDVLSRRARNLFDLMSTACIVTFCFAAAYGYSKTAWTKFSTWELYGSAWNPPIPAIMKPLIVITCTWMGIQAINNLIADWNRPEHPQNSNDQA